MHTLNGREVQVLRGIVTTFFRLCRFHSAVPLSVGSAAFGGGSIHPGGGGGPAGWLGPWSVCPIAKTEGPRVQAARGSIYPPTPVPINTDKEEDDNNDDDPFQNVDEIDSFTHEVN